MIICYTSGTTGVPKGVTLSHGNVVCASSSVIHCDGLRPTDRTLLPVGLAFVGPLVDTSLPMLRAGGSVVLEAELEPGNLLHHVRDSEVTVLSVVPYVYQALLDADGFGADAVRGLRAAKSGGAPIPEALIRAFLDFGVPLVGSYGLAEASGFTLQLPADDAIRKLGFAGVPAMGQNARILAADGSEDAEPFDTGEIAIAGDAVMLGYWRDPDATEAAIVDGWVRTGDLGIVDDEGFFKIVDRAKDMIISGGLNIYPAEIERAAAAHPDVAEVAVIGVDDERWGEVPVACVVSRGAAISLEDLNGFLNHRLADYKLPRRIEMLASLPRNMSNKVIKRELRDRFAGGVRPRGRRLEGRLQCLRACAWLNASSWSTVRARRSGGSAARCAPSRASSWALSRSVAALGRAGLSPDAVDEVYFGVTMPAEEALDGSIPARVAMLRAGISDDRLSLTIDRACCSSMTATHLAVRAIRSGAAEIAVAAGADNMGRSAFLMDPELRWARRGAPRMKDPLAGLGADIGGKPVAVDAGEVAVEWGVDRQAADEWALRSHRKYFEALEAGFFVDEITPYPLGAEAASPALDADEGPRRDTSMAALGALPTVLGSPLVTAGNAPGQDTGACAIVVASEAACEARGIDPLAEIAATSSIARTPREARRRAGACDRGAPGTGGDRPRVGQAAGG